MLIRKAYRGFESHLSTWIKIAWWIQGVCLNSLEISSLKPVFPVFEILLLLHISLKAELGGCTTCHLTLVRACNYWSCIYQAMAVMLFLVGSTVKTNYLAHGLPSVCLPASLVYPGKFLGETKVLYCTLGSEIGLESWVALVVQEGDISLVHLNMEQGVFVCHCCCY